MALPAENDISCKRGDTKRHIFTISSSTTNQPIDISGWKSFVLAVNEQKAPEDTSTEIGQLSGFFTTDGTDGRVHFHPPGDWPTGKYFYDAQAVDSNDEKFTFVQGRYNIIEDIAKA